MNLPNRLLIVAAALLATASATEAKVTVSPIFSDNMVLQQQATVTMHGKSAPGNDVKIKTSWNGKTVKTHAEADSTWSAQFDTPVHGGPYTITVSDRDSKEVFENILVGDVWVCGGQSNMEMSMSGFSGQPVEGTLDMIVKADPKRRLRLFQQPRDYSTTPKDTPAGGTWVEQTPAAVREFSAVGYIFGDLINEVIDIPVGLIQCAYSDSKIEAWMPREALETNFPDIALPTADQTEFGWLTGTPTLLYNAMVNPWKGFPVKGVVWYQGEANNPYPQLYKQLFPVMVREWQKVFVNDSLPFYYVQLASYNAGDCEALNYAEFRQAQADLLYMVPNVAMATIGDAGDPVFIHAPRKLKAGQRLAYLALDKTYGREGADVRPPIARAAGYNPNDSTIWVTFDNPGRGLIPTQCYLDEFEVVDADGNVYEAKAKTFGGNGVTVWSPIADPVEVRYGFHNCFEATLFNNMHIPASPFRLGIAKPQSKK